MNYELTLTRKNRVFVETLGDAKDVFLKWIAVNAFGSSDLQKDSGMIRKDGNRVARLSYNGRMWTIAKNWKDEQEIFPTNELTTGKGN